jgi:putative ABC transport system permease protein
MRNWFSSSDLTLGWRLLFKYPGLAVASVFALAVAIGLGAAWHEFATTFMRPALPFPDAGRLVEIEMRDLRRSAEERRIAGDFDRWRRNARTVDSLGAWRTIDRTFAVRDAVPEVLTVAEITASAFPLLRVAPAAGRTLLPEDERPGAPAVIVINYRTWQRAFGGNADVLGRTIDVSGEPATIIGVMPDGFAFPVNHDAWMPLAGMSRPYAPREGPAIRVFGRVAAGVTQAQANQEIEALTAAAAAETPAAYEQLRPRVLAYGGESVGVTVLGAAIIHAPVLLVLLLACINVGTLMFARTAARASEIATRSALGASRSRIAGQLFAEALVLALVAAALGLVGAHFVLTRGVAVFYSGQTGGKPFWIDPGVHLTTIVFAIGLAIVAALILSVLPALSATGRHVQAILREMGGTSTPRVGRLWSAAIVVQVALTIIALPPTMGITGEAVRDRLIRGQYPAQQYLGVRMELDRDRLDAPESAAATAERITRRYRDLEDRVRREPGVLDVTFGDQLPGVDPSVVTVHVEQGKSSRAPGQVWRAAIGPRYFDIFDRAVLAGRAFDGGDHAEADRVPQRGSGSDEGSPRAVIVNQGFARRFLGSANPVGARLRYPAADETAPAEWFEVVGMVRDIGMTPTDFGEAPFVYHAASPGTVSPLMMTVRVRGNADALAGRIRTLAAGVDSALRLTEVRSLDDWAWRADVPQMTMAGGLVLMVLLGLSLSAGAIFSLMSVTVARRTREIGLRAALGADAVRLLSSMFSRAGVLVGSGVAIGNAVIIFAVLFGTDDVPVAYVGTGLSITTVVVIVVALLACIAPARRALRINPTEALRAS